jgi:lipopolysaccharide export system protein LptA
MNHRSVRRLLVMLLAVAGALPAAEPPVPKADPKANAAPKTEATPKGKADAKAAEAKPQEPVHLWADNVRYVRPDGLVRVTGDATIIKGDTRIDATEVLGYLDENNQFLRLVATGNVKITIVIPLTDHPAERPPVQPAPEPNARRAVCHVADYDLAKKIITLTGDPNEPDVQPIVWMNKDEVHADKIIMDELKGLTTFEGRVKLAALTPKGEGAKLDLLPAPKGEPKPDPKGEPKAEPKAEEKAEGKK